MLLFGGIAAAVLMLDGLAKAVATRFLAGGGITALRGVLELRLTRNNGIALGLLSGNTAAIVLLPLAVIAGGIFLLRRYVPTVYTRAACGLIAGGFLGNFIERVCKGYVVDMIYFPFLPWFVCNVADIAICAGVVMLAWSLMMRPQDWREKRAEDKPNRAQ